MNQQIYFKFILQYLEFSSKIEQSQYELTIMLKRGASQQTIAKVQVKNPERTSTICRLPLDQTIELTQKMLYKDGEYADCNIKFLFYLFGTQLLGDCVINLAFFLNNGPDQKIKKPLTSTNDKRAALLFKILLKNSHESQEFPQMAAPAPVHQPTHQPPQTPRIPSTRKMEFSNRPTRARSQSPPKEFKSNVLVSKTNETVQPQQQDNLTQKLTQLGEKFQQEKLQQSIPPPQEEQDNFKETVETLQQQEEEIQKQLQILETKDFRSKEVRNKMQIIDAAQFGGYQNQNQNNINNSFNEEWKQKYQELEEKYNKVNDENQHLKRIIRQQSEQLKKQIPQFQQKQSENPLNQSQISDHTEQYQQYERTIEKKNQLIQKLSNQVLELEKSSNLNIVEQMRVQIGRLEQQIQEKETQWLETEKIYKEKIFNFMQQQTL